MSTAVVPCRAMRAKGPRVEGATGYIAHKPMLDLRLQGGNTRLKEQSSVERHDQTHTLHDTPSVPGFRCDRTRSQLTHSYGTRSASGPHADIALEGS